jgi:hypothetical protein
MSSNDDILRAIGRLEGKVDHLVQDLITHTGRMNRIDSHIEKQDERIRTLEKKQYAVIAVATFLGSMISLVLRKYF